MSIIITGSTGHIGNNIARYLAEKNEDIVLLVRRIDKSIEDINAKKILGNVFDKNFLEDNIKEGDVVIHLAGVIDIKNNKKEETLKINYEGTKTLLDVSIKNKASRFIYFSTTDCILKENEIIKEPATMYPEKLPDNYNHSKALATKYVMDMRNENKDIMINILYPSAVIGINDYKPSAIGKVVKDIIDNKMQFGIKGGYNFVDVTDISEATYNLLQLKNNEDYLLTGRYVSIIEFYKIVNKVLNKRKTTIKIPLFLVYPFIPFVPYLSKFVIKTINQNPNFDNSKFKDLLNKDITKFEDTIKNTTEFFKNN